MIKEIGFSALPPDGIPLRKYLIEAVGHARIEIYDFVDSITVHHTYKDLWRYGLLNTLGDGFEGTIVDIGASVGLYTIAAKRLYPHATLVSVEPLKNTFALLKYNVEHNAVATALGPYAVGKERGQTILSWDPRNPGSASTIHSGPEAEIVEVRTLPAILDGAKVAVADFVKLDIEGLEYEVLQGLEDEDWARIKRLSVELHGVLMFPHATNNAIYTDLSLFLKVVALQHDVIIEVCWPTDQHPKPSTGLHRWWNANNSSLLFPGKKT